MLIRTDDLRGSLGGEASAAAETLAVGSTGKLGLAFAGGGFRASLFHLGVLLRLAELDVLRRVEVISTVSGGTVTGALYALLLKKYLERADNGDLQRDRYVQLVTELAEILTTGIRKNLRTRLVMNPFGILLTIVTHDSLGRRMGRLYERYLLEPIVRDLRPDRPWWHRWLIPGRLQLGDLVIRPGGNDIKVGLEAYNQEKRSNGGSVVTSIIMNATTLNSAGRFFFTAVELGDWYLGSFRKEEFALLVRRKKLLEADQGAEPSITASQDTKDEDAERVYRRITLAKWWRARRQGVHTSAAPAGWESIFAIGFPGELSGLALGRLRPMKQAAWYVLSGMPRGVRGGKTVQQHLTVIREGIRDVDPDLSSAIDGADFWQDERTKLVAEFILELYYLRTAEQVSKHIERDWSRLRVGHAIGASACFPPVFPPFLIYGVYDDLVVARLGLTDGGVYDNAGTTALLDENCDAVIASDTGGTFDEASNSPTERLGLVARIPGILMRALGGTQREQLRERRRVSRAIAQMLPPPPDKWTEQQNGLDAFRTGRQLDELAYFHISSPRVTPSQKPEPIDLPGVDPMAVAKVRTDLDGFGDAEIAILVDHGYDMADRYARQYLTSDLVNPKWAAIPPKAPLTLPVERRIAPTLVAARALFFRALKLGAPESWVFSALAIAAIGWLAWRGGVSLVVVLNALGSVLDHVIRQPIDDVAAFAAAGLRTVFHDIPDFSQQTLSQRPGFVVALIVLCGLGLLVWSANPESEHLRIGKRARLVRVLISARKWARAYAGNVLWLAWYLPAWIAGVLAIVGNVSYVFFYLPFRRACGVRK